MKDEDLLLKALTALREADDDNWLTNIGYEAIVEIEARLGLPHQETGRDREKAREE